MVELKEPKNFNEQIEILKERELIIEDEEFAKFVLSNVNYYRFTAYLLHFKIDEYKYMEGTTFELIYELYKFDRELRSLITDVLGSIEISFRTYIAYTLAMNYGAIGYLDKNNFKNAWYHCKFIVKLDIEKNNNSNKLFIKHHNQKYGGKLPVWVATEIMTFGMLSKLYANLLPIDKNYIKNNLCKINPKLVDTWLQSLTHIRNQCAHYGRIYNNLFPIIKIKNEDKNYEIDDKKIFAYILAMKHLVVDQVIWNKFFINLQQLISNYDKYIDLNRIGFPENWIEILSRKS